MLCRNLKSLALNTIVHHLCEESFSTIQHHLAGLLRQDGIFEMFAQMIFQCMVEMYPHFVSDQLLEICCHGNLKEINIKNCKMVSLEGLNVALKRCSSVICINLSECDQLICTELINSLQMNAKQLSCLKLDGCEKLTDEILQMALHSLPHLTELSCESCDSIDKLTLLRAPGMITSLSNLSTVNVSSCRQLTCTFIRHLTTLTRSNLQSLNVSGTSIDCIALVYLAGYSLSSAVNIATNLKDSTSEVPLKVEATESIVDGCSKQESSCEDNVFVAELDRVETASSYIKQLCAYCSNDLAVRKHSECVDSIKVFSITESFDDYDIVDSQVVNIREMNELSCSRDGNVDDDLEWAVLSVNAVCLDDIEKCTCSPTRSFSGGIPNSSGTPDCGADINLALHADAVLSSEIDSSDALNVDGTLHFEETPSVAVNPEEALNIENTLDREQALYVHPDSDEVTNCEDNSITTTPYSDLIRPFNEKDLMCEQIFAPNITSLDVSNTQVHDTGIYSEEVLRECFRLFLMSNKGIKNFHMSWVGEEVSDGLVSMIAELQPSMENISLAGCIRISNVGITDLVDKFDNLKAIDVSGVSFVDDRPLIKLVTKHNNLQFLSFAESCLTDKVLEKISNSLNHSLRHLDLSWCENISDEGVVKVLSSCTKLKYLDLRQCEITSYTIKGITENGTNLSVIGLSGIRGLNDATCTKMVKNLPNLRRADLSWNSFLTDESISCMCHSCPCLHEIIISGLKRISSKPFLHIISGLSEWREARERILSRLYSQMLPNTHVNARERYVSNFEALDSDFYLPFRSVNYVPELRKLTLGYCDKVNDNHLSEIVAVCRGTLMIEDYYGASIKEKWADLPVKKDRQPQSR